MSASRLLTAHARLEDLELRPLADPVLGRVLSDCPSCAAGADDPARIYRPLRTFQPVDGRRDAPIRFECSAGCSDDAVRRGFQRAAGA
jgi:hypothetical protein